MRSWLIVVWVLALSACAGHPAPTLRPALISEQLAAAVERAQETELQLHQQGQVSYLDHQLWQRRFLALGQGILAFNAGMRTLQPAQRDAALRDLVAIVDEMVTVLVPHLDFDQAKIWLTTALETIRAMLVTVSVTG